MTPEQTDKLVEALDKISKRLTVISIAQETQAELLTSFFARVDYYLQVNSEDIRFTNPMHIHSGTQDSEQTDKWYYGSNPLLDRKHGEPDYANDFGSSEGFLKEDDRRWGGEEPPEKEEK
tara:strand:+ start:139 stop:498 length:360 start_codon:yes stop_codon:yes gene_type:complete